MNNGTTSALSGDEVSSKAVGVPDSVYLASESLPIDCDTMPDEDFGGTVNSVQSSATALDAITLRDKSHVLTEIGDDLSSNQTSIRAESFAVSENTNNLNSDGHFSKTRGDLFNDVNLFDVDDSDVKLHITFNESNNLIDVSPLNSTCVGPPSSQDFRAKYESDNVPSEKTESNCNTSFSTPQCENEEMLQSWLLIDRDASQGSFHEGEEIEAEIAASKEDEVSNVSFMLPATTSISAGNNNASSATCQQPISPNNSENLHERHSSDDDCSLVNNQASSVKSIHGSSVKSPCIQIEDFSEDTLQDNEELTVKEINAEDHWLSADYERGAISRRNTTSGLFCLLPSRMRKMQSCQSCDEDSCSTSSCRSCGLILEGFKEINKRLDRLHLTGPRCRVSSGTIARRLFPRRQSWGEASLLAVPEPSKESLTERINVLENRMVHLEHKTTAAADVQIKLQRDNAQLIQRVHELEEEVCEHCAQTEKRQMKRDQNFDSNLSHLKEQKAAQESILNRRLQQQLDENAAFSATIIQLKTLTQRLDKEKESLSDQLDQTEGRLQEEASLQTTLSEHTRRENLSFQREHVATQELIDELRREVNILQTRLSQERKKLHYSRARAKSESHRGSRETELEQEVRRLQQESNILRDQNEELKSHLVALNLCGAKNLFGASTKLQSVSLDPSASREQVLEALQEIEEINWQLRQYMDRIILGIMVNNPSILEIKP